MPKKLVISLGLLAAVAVVGALWANAPISPLPSDAKADLLVVNKGGRQLLAYSHGQLLRSYRVSLGREPVGPKIRQGDGKTPEGDYVIDAHNPHSAFHRALHVSYPSAADVARARATGSRNGLKEVSLEIRETSRARAPDSPSPGEYTDVRTARPDGEHGYDPGGEIMVHGIHNGLGWIGRAHRFVDWTVGCIALTDPEIEELYRIVPDGTPIEIKP
jgi:murein L,D-transpeptidase YafK